VKERKERKNKGNWSEDGDFHPENFERPGEADEK